MIAIYHKYFLFTGVFLFAISLIAIIVKDSALSRIFAIKIAVSGLVLMLATWSLSKVDYYGEIIGVVLIFIAVILFVLIYSTIGEKRKC